MIAWISAGPFLVMDKFKLNTFIFGIFQALVFGSLIIGSQCVKYLITKMEINNLINLGLIICLSGSIIGFTLSIIYPDFLPGLVLSLMIFTFGSSLAYSPSQRIAIEACKEPMGARMAVLSSMMCSFGVIGGLLVSSTYNGTLLWMTTLLLTVSIIACFLRWLVNTN